MTDDQITLISNELSKVLDRFESIRTLSPEIKEKMEETYQLLLRIDTIFGAAIRITRGAKEIITILEQAEGSSPDVKEVLLYFMKNVKKD